MPTYDIVVNPRANRGGSGATLRQLERELAERGAKFVVHHTKRPRQAADIAQRLVADGRRGPIVVVGGDGSIFDALGGIAGQDIPMGIIPAGTGNDVAIMLGIPRDTSKATDTLIRQRTSLVDHAIVNGRLRAISFVGYGIAAELVRGLQGFHTNNRINYFRAMLQKLYSFRAQRYNVRWEGPAGEGGQQGLLADFLSIHNCVNAGGGMHLCHEAKMDDGHQDLLIVEHRGMVRRLLNVLAVATKTLHFQPNVRIIPVTKVEIQSPNDTNCCIDGEIIHLDEISLEVVPASITVIH